MSELFIYISQFPAKHFPRLLYQTRYGGICFACFPQRSRASRYRLQRRQTTEATSMLAASAFADEPAHAQPPGSRAKGHRRTDFALAHPRPGFEALKAIRGIC